MNYFVKIINDNAARYGEREALRYRDYNTQEWTSMSWNSLKTNVERAAQAFYNLGMKEQDRMCVFSPNCPEILISHFAAFRNRGVVAPIYATSSRDEVAHIVSDSGARFIFTGDQSHYEVARSLVDECESLEKIIVMDPRVKIAAGDKVAITWEQFMAAGDKATQKQIDGLAARMEAGVEEDLIYFIYTSGTTGEPKGVMLTHFILNSCMRAHEQRIYVDPDNDLSLSFLPYSHVFELGWTLVCLTRGARVAINYDTKDIQKSVKEIKPTCMCSVPRFWEKVYTAVNDNFSQAAPVLKMFIKRALAVGKARNLKYVRNGRKAPALLEKQYQFFDEKVFKKVRQAVGIENGRLFPTAGAMLSDRITEYLHSIGVNIMIGYGLSETTATVSCYEDAGWELGTVGTPIPGWEVKIGKDNEILVRGNQMFKGYYNKPEETARVIDKDGWFHTGDCGEINEKGQIILVDRIKDLFKTSNGKYIAPQVLETLLIQDKYIDEVVIIGDGRKYVSALIVPNFDEVKAFAAKHKIAYNEVSDLVNDPALHKELEDRINGYQKNMASYEQIKRFVILPRPFSKSAGEMTNTLKLRRAAIIKHYAVLIDAMYAADYRKKKADK